MNTTLLIIASLVALGWTALTIRLFRLGRGDSFRFLEVHEGALADFPTVEAVVPARNEEANVEATIRALREQDYPALSLTVVDDQSSDATAEILERLSKVGGVGAPLRFVRGIERPAGWVGKTWAVHQGALGTSSEWLWFVDADMGLHPRALVSALAEAARTKADLVSLLPGVHCKTFWQGAIAASLVQLLGQLYPLNRVNDPARPEAIAAGGFILVRRSSYEKAGGHEAVRREIVEDIQLAKRVKESGGKLSVKLAPSLAWTHMYGSFHDIWRGLRKNAYAGMDYLPHKYVVGSIVGLLMAWAPWIAFAVGLVGQGVVMGVVGGWGILAQVGATLPVLIFLRLSWPFAFSLPLGITAYVAIASSSVWHHHRGRILWKDRAIPTETVVAPLGNAGESADGFFSQGRPEK